MEKNAEYTYTYQIRKETHTLKVRLSVSGLLYLVLHEYLLHEFI